MSSSMSLSSFSDGIPKEENNDDDTDDSYDDVMAPSEFLNADNLQEPFDFDLDAMEILWLDNLMRDSKMPPIVKKVGSSLKNNQQKLQSLARKRRQAAMGRIHDRKRKLRTKMTQPDFVRTMDKVSFIMGIVIIMVTEFVLLTIPEKMGLLYTILLVPLMAVRYLLYRMEKMHYFMYDFCYFCQVLMLLLLHRFPSEQYLKICFAISNGPLAVATILWRNSLVFHSMDKMTSSFMHMLPALVTFCLKWQESLDKKQFPMPHASSSRESDDLQQVARDFLVFPMLLYIMWQGLYLTKTEIVSKKKLTYNTEMMTSLRWLTKNPKSASYKLLTRFGTKHQLTTFVIYQGIYTLLTLLTTPLLWYSMRLHALYLCVIFVVALTNGAAYYFHIFAVRYIDQLGNNSNHVDSSTGSEKQQEEGTSRHSSSLSNEGNNEEKME